MGLLDTLRSLLGGDGESPGGGTGESSGGPGARTEVETRTETVAEPDDLFGPVARHYVETGEAPDEEWAAAERDGVVEVLVTVAGEPTPEEPVETEAVEEHLESLGGAVEHAHGGGTVSGLIHKSKLLDLADHEEVVRVEVTRSGGDVTEDPDYPGAEGDGDEDEDEDAEA